MEFPDNNGDTGYNEIDFKDNFFAIIQRDLDKNIHILEVVDPINFLKSKANDSTEVDGYNVKRLVIEGVRQCADIFREEGYTIPESDQ